MLYGTLTVKEAHCFKAVLNLFRQASGMDLNLDKSSSFFHTHLAIQRYLTNILGFKRRSLPSKYLGIPLTRKPWQKLHWEHFLSKLEDRSNYWTNKILNLAGRLAMTKAVLQAIPHYMLSILPAPKMVLQKIKNIQRAFLWSRKVDKQRWALVAWAKICKPKNLRGLGLQDPDTINKACGAKLWWH